MADDAATPDQAYITIDPLEVAMTAMQGMLSNPSLVLSDGSPNIKLIGILAWEAPAAFAAGLKWQQELASGVVPAPEAG